MPAQSVAEFLDYWVDEGQQYARRGDYQWMASLISGTKLLEIGCGPGFSTQALIDRGFDILVAENEPACLSQMRSKSLGKVGVLEADILALTSSQKEEIEKFEPDTVVCWLMGAPSSVTSASQLDAGQAVVAYREKMHRAITELANNLPSVMQIHFIDRTVMPWQAKDIGRDTLVNYHNEKTLSGLPFSASRENATYRKIEASPLEAANIRRLYPTVKGVVPVLASLLAKRKK